MAYVLDAGALIAAERGDRRVVALLAAATADGIPIRVPSGVVAQVWRGGTRQARLARLLDATHEVELDTERSRAVGALLASSSTTDVIDASVVELCRGGDVVLTSDRDEIAHLILASEKRVSISRV